MAHFYTVFLYINYNLSTSCADDSFLIKISEYKMTSSLQNDLFKLQKWQDTWLMKFDPDRCYWMTLATRHPHVTCIPSVWKNVIWTNAWPSWHPPNLTIIELTNMCVETDSYIGWCHCHKNSRSCSRPHSQESAIFFAFIVFTLQPLCWIYMHCNEHAADGGCGGGLDFAYRLAEATRRPLLMTTGTRVWTLNPSTLNWTTQTKIAISKAQETLTGIRRNINKCTTLLSFT